MRRIKHLHKHLHERRHNRKRQSESQSPKKQTIFNKIKSIWQRLGPGLITGASDDDPSGITTYSQAGAGYGLSTLWTALMCFPLMAAIQEMCGRIGLVTGQGLTKVVKRHYPKWIIYLIGIVSVPAIILNIAADLAGMGAVSNMIFPIIPAWVFTILAALAVMFSVVLFSYKKLEEVLKYLGLILLLYFIIPFMIKQDWAKIGLATIIPHFELNKDFIAIIVAILGTTISPYLFFWEASLEVEQYNSKHHKTSEPDQISDQNLTDISPIEMKEMRQDNNFGMFFSEITMFFIILTTGSVLFPNGITSIATVQDAATALKPFAGDFAYILFALGVIGTGFLAIPVLAGACGYIISEMFDWQEGMNNKFAQARGFYEVICFSILIGLGLSVSGMDPIKSLIWSAIVYGVTAPILIFIILHIANREDIMGKWKNGWLANSLGIIGLVLMTLAAGLLIYTSFV